MLLTVIMLSIAASTPSSSLWSAPGGDALVVAQADPAEEAFGEPPPPPLPPGLEEEAAPPVVEEQSAPPPAPERRKAKRSRRARDRDNDEPVDGMLAGIITGAAGVVVAVPVGGMCAICSCLACPGPLVCAPASTGLGAVAGLLIAGADFEDTLLPASAAAAISFGSALVAIGSAFFWAVGTGAINNAAANAGVNSNLGLVNNLVFGGLAFGCLSLGAVGAGAAVMALAPAGGDDEDEYANVGDPAADELPLPSRVAARMAY